MCCDHSPEPRSPEQSASRSTDHTGRFAWPLGFCKRLFGHSSFVYYDFFSMSFISTGVLQASLFPSWSLGVFCSNRPWLPVRILYGWAKNCGSQRRLKRGGSFLQTPYLQMGVPFRLEQQDRLLQMPFLYSLAKQQFTEAPRIQRLSPRIVGFTSGQL
jgi:hypothetical protein